MSYTFSRLRACCARLLFLKGGGWRSVDVIFIFVSHIMSWVGGVGGFTFHLRYVISDMEHINGQMVAQSDNLKSRLLLF